MVAKDRKNITGSPKVEVGEIDTRSPFQSVKDAVNLFGEGAFSGERSAIKKSKPQSTERALAKETQLHLAQTQLNKLKDQLKNAEETKAQALMELEKTKRTVGDLTEKLRYVTESKESAIQATEAAKDQANKLQAAISGSPVNDVQKKDLESRTEEYVSTIAELDAAKQFRRQLRQDRDAIVEEKDAAFKQLGEAEVAARVNMERAVEIFKEINTVQESIGQAKLVTMQAQQEQAVIISEKDVQKQAYKVRLEESTRKVLALKKEFNPESAKDLRAQIAETVTDVGTFQKEMENAKASDIDSVKTVTLELDGAKDSLKKVVKQESSLRSLIGSLKIELENMKKEHIKLKDKEAETEAIARNLNVKLRKAKSDLEIAVTEGSRVEGASEEMISTLNQMLKESEKARSQSEELKKQAEELKNEAEATRLALEEAEKQLQVATMEAEEAKAAEKKALDQIKELSERTDATRASTSESGAKITISKDEFEALSRKVEESNMLAEMKVAAAMAQVDAMRASENEAVKKLEMTQKEIDDIKAATQEALKKAELAEAAKKAVEGELRRWREREQKKAAEAASLILAEKKKSLESSPKQQQVQKQIFSSSLDRDVVPKKLERRRTFLSKRFKLSGIFRRKKNQVGGSYAQSYLPGEQPI